MSGELRIVLDEFGSGRELMSEADWEWAVRSGALTADTRVSVSREAAPSISIRAGDVEELQSLFDTSRSSDSLRAMQILMERPALTEGSTMLPELLIEAADELFSLLDAAEDKSLRALMLAADVDEMNDANLVGANLRAESLVGISFVGADFSGADLRECDLRYCDLRGAIFSGAKMEGAILDFAKTEDAVFDHLPTEMAAAPAVEQPQPVRQRASM